MQRFLDVEVSLVSLSRLDSSDKHSQYAEAINKVAEGRHADILQSAFAKKLFASDSATCLEAVLRRNVDEIYKSTDEKDQAEKEFELLLVAVASLQLFVQNNWLGPRPSDISPKQILPESLEDEKLTLYIQDELSVDGEPVYGLTTYPEFLFIARTLLLLYKDRFKHLQTYEWWLLRCISVHQQILDDKSNTLRETAIHLIDNMQRRELLMANDKYRDVQIQFHIEAANLSHVYYRYREAHVHINTARKLSGLSIELTGAMGRRTRFQESDRAQLLLKVTRDTEVSPEVTDGRELEVVPDPQHMPKRLALDDDTLLEAINFTDADMKPTIVSATEQALILGIMEDYRRRQASGDTLTEEEVQAYLSFVLSDARSWSVTMAALLLRSKLEKGSRRHIDRSMRQLEELFNHTLREEPSAGQRSRLFYAVKIVPVWETQKQLAEILLALGAIGSALEIFEDLELWEEAIACYQRLGKVEKAETVIREQLAVKETPNLWCFLGDITRNIEHYEKAWELSKHKSARAQRCMGYLYFAKEQYEKCLECFEKSLQVNALQVPVWFTYGCAAMAAENYKLAVKAFKRCTAIDYDNYEAWNNLASAYIKLREKKKAFATLNDAIKCNYENWRIWENYLLVATDCGEFGEAIRAYHRLIDLREKWVDEQVLGILVRAVVEKIPDAHGVTADSVEPKLRELFGRITARVTDKAEIWRLYAQLCAQDLDKMLQYLQKAHRCVMQTSNWEKDVERCQDVAEQSLQLADTYSSACSSTSDATKLLQMMSSAKLMLRGVLTKIKQQHTDPISQTLSPESVQKICDRLEEKLNTIVQTIENLKAS